MFGQQNHVEHQKGFEIQVLSAGVPRVFSPSGLGSIITP
jgi:hypothetical protein